MTLREQAINSAFEAFARARRQPLRALAVLWVNMGLAAAGLAELTADEVDLCMAAADMGWVPPHQRPPTGCSEFDRLPDSTRVISVRRSVHRQGDPWPPDSLAGRIHQQANLFDVQWAAQAKGKVQP